MRRPCYLCGKVHNTEKVTMVYSTWHRRYFCPAKQYHECRARRRRQLAAQQAQGAGV